MKALMAALLRLMAAVLVLWTSLENAGDWSRIAAGYALAAYVMLVVVDLERKP